MGGGGAAPRNGTLDLTHVRVEVPYGREGTVLMQNFRPSGPDLETDRVKTAYMNCIIANPKWLYDATLMDADMFDYPASSVWLWVTECSHARLMWEDHTRTSDPGNRCKLAVRHTLLLALVHMKKGNNESETASEFLTSQSTVCRYLDMIRAALADILPTPHTLTDIIRAVYDELGKMKAHTEPAEPAENNLEDTCPDPRLLDIPPWKVFDRGVALSYMPAPPPATLTGAPLSSAPALPAFHHGPALCLTDTPPSTEVFMLMDATHVPIEKYGDPTWNRLTFSGKVGAATYNTNAVSDPGGLALWISPSVPGSVHDMRLLKDHMPDFGYLTDIMRAGPPGGARPVLVVDKGYIGAQKMLLGTSIMIPVKRRMGSDEGAGCPRRTATTTGRWPRSGMSWSSAWAASSCSE